VRRLSLVGSTCGNLSAQYHAYPEVHILPRNFGSRTLNWALSLLLQPIPSILRLARNNPNLPFYSIINWLNEIPHTVYQNQSTMSGLEVIGVVASIAGIINVTSKVMGAVGDYATAVKNHEGSIKELQTALQSMNTTLLHIQELINEADDRSDQSLIKILQGSGANLGEIGECRRTLGELETLIQKYQVAEKELGWFDHAVSKCKAKSRRFFSPITDEDIGKFTSRLGEHCGELSLNIGVDTK